LSRNRLADEFSPYLLQHKDNPVHWWPWGIDALAEARRTGKPVLLSVGYAACHWCHVMAHESFEDPATAEVMNDLFVNIKVDREERPDIDAIYMAALHRLDEPGGWPLTMFLDSDGRPFWGGTYFPREARYGKPAFSRVLREVAQLYREEPDKVSQNAEALTRMLAARPEAPQGQLDVDDPALANLTGRLVSAIDPVHGGLKGAPKFPQWSFFWLLWRGAIRYNNLEARTAVETTLTQMCLGGIYDHLGGGVSRYAVDERWLIPHFEKMLYDNALLIDLLTEAWRETGTPLYQSRVEQTVAWLAREMMVEGGGFAASLDADSDGGEGSFYLWTLDEIRQALGEEDANVFAATYGVTEGGNFEGRSILNRLDSGHLGLAAATGKQGMRDSAAEALEMRIAALRLRLFEHRERRVRPARDDKVLADWNGLAIAALARAGVVFHRADWLALARDAFAFVLTEMSDGDRLHHAWRAGRATARATAADYATLIHAAIRLHEATGEAGYVGNAEVWADVLDRHYRADRGGYYMTADDTSDVLVRLYTAQDDATPSANGLMVGNLVRLWLLTGRSDYLSRAQEIPVGFAPDLQVNLLSHCGLLASLHDLNAPAQVVVLGEDLALTGALSTLSLPGALELRVVAPEPLPSQGPLAGKTEIDGKPTAYVCIGTTCRPPVTTPRALVAQCREMRSASADPGTAKT
jgi:uncharacterized protein